MELLSNEYHLIGPIVSPLKRNGCSLDCKGRAIDDVSRRRRSVGDQRDGVCGCARFPRRGSPRSPREETLRTSIVDRLEDSEPIFYSTRMERDNASRHDREFNADVSDVRDDRRRRDTIKMERRDVYAEEPLPGPSRRPGAALPVPARNAKKARVEDREEQRADEEDDETTTEEDTDCACDAEVVTRDERSRIRPPGRPRVIVRNQRNERRDDAEEDEENEEERMKREAEEDGEERMEEEDEDTEEDSAYEELIPAQGPRRPTARERELKRWIRRCRQECERRRGR